MTLTGKTGKLNKGKDRTGYPENVRSRGIFYVYLQDKSFFEYPKIWSKHPDIMSLIG